MKNILFQIKSLGGCVFQPFQQYVRSPQVRKTTRYAKAYKKYSVKNNIVLYEAFMGRGMLCNPYAIFWELFENPKYKKLKHVWVLDDIEQHSDLLAKYKKNSNVFFVQRETKEYFKYLSKAKYLVNNSTFPGYFTKKAEQIYVNTWHGIPLKTLGFDLPDGKRESFNVLRNFLQADYILSANSFLTQIYRKTFKLEGLMEGKIIEEGYPRLDLIFRDSREDALKKLKEKGLCIDEKKKLILFTPTWRGMSYAEASSDISYYFDFYQYVTERIDTDRYQVLVKPHQRVYELAKDKMTGDFFVPATIDANELMGVADIMISDFSSIFYDYLATGKPILFYIPDLAEYQQTRGMYHGCEHLPGPYTDNMEQLCAWIRDINNVFNENKEKYEERKEWSNTISDGKIASRIVDIVFNNREEGYKIYKETFSKKKILFSCGVLRTNGIASALLNLLKIIDYNKYDVSLMVPRDPRKEDEEQIRNIPKEVRLFYRNSPNNFTFGENVLHFYLDRYIDKNQIRPMYQREWKRTYGGAKFDYVIDFEGLNSWFAKLIVNAGNCKKIIWQHSDQMSEYKMRFPWLDKIFALYQYCDKVISCGKETMKLNRQKMAGKYCEYEKFDYVNNAVDAERVLSGIKQDYIQTYEGKKVISANEMRQSGIMELKLVPYHHEINEKGKRNYRFVAMGRLSPEKNHTNLLYAFAALCKKRDDAYLYIIGDGPLCEKTESLIGSLNLGNRVILTGNICNPFSVMKYCDCFIQPSLHEGQSMVLNEVRIAKMPIIISDAVAETNELLENGQLIVGTEAEEILRGMEAFMNGEVPCDYEFDANVYNQLTYEGFLRAIGVNNE